MGKFFLANRAFRFGSTLRGYANAGNTAVIEQLWVHTGPSLHFYMIILNFDDYQNGVICTKIA